MRFLQPCQKSALSVREVQPVAGASDEPTDLSAALPEIGKGSVKYTAVIFSWISERAKSEIRVGKSEIRKHHRFMSFGVLNRDF